MLARSLCLLAILSLANACASEPPPMVATPAKARPAVPKAASLPAGHLARADVDEALSKGPPWLLRRVAVEEVLREGKFVGWRVVAMPAEWTAIDLKAGDVVTRVNGMPLERPDDLYTAWSSLVVASDLKVAYERAGAAREVVFHIEGAPAKDSPVPAADAPPPPRKRAAKSTVVITEETSPADTSD
jgi:hypothetical protein